MCRGDQEKVTSNSLALFSRFMGGLLLLGGSYFLLWGSFASLAVQYNFRL